MLYSNSPAHLEIRNLSVSYNNGARRALDEVSFSVTQGTRVAVVGPNGAGKSTLFKALVGLAPLERGEILIRDAALSVHKADDRLRVAYVPQRKEVDWRFPVSVNDVVMMGRYGALGWLKRPTKRDHEAVQRALAEMDISKLANYPIGELSGGQQQRVFLARALAQEPHILLMDEPFTGVDATTQEATLELLNQLQARGVTLIVSTHDLNLAAARFDRVLLLNHSVIAYGAPAQVFTTENLMRAFGTHAMFVEGKMIVDDCCAGDAPPALGESPALEMIER